MLLLTLRISLPSVVRFMVCAGILYIAFLLLGWLVLGPYHPKVTDSIAMLSLSVSPVVVDVKLLLQSQVSQ